MEARADAEGVVGVGAPPGRSRAESHKTCGATSSKKKKNIVNEIYNEDSEAVVLPPSPLVVVCPDGDWTKRIKISLIWTRSGHPGYKIPHFWTIAIIE